MAIQFRCPGCRKKLSIAQRKAGAVVRCPACDEQIRVPLEDGGEGELVLASARQSESIRDAASDHEPLDRSPHLMDSEDEEGGFHLSGRRVGDDDGLDMTPMVDVTFLLLIFFMITASFSLQKSMETEAPQEDQDGFAQLPQIQDLADESVIVEIDENDGIFVDDEPVNSIGALQDVLLRKMSTEQKREMIIEPHYQAKHGTVVAVTDAGIEVGMQRIRRAFKSNSD